jgi:predicted ATP-binding protein involved in virulence
MYIKELVFKNYKGLRDVSFELDPHMNVFCGDNGSGKTSIIEMIPPMFASLNPLDEKAHEHLSIKSRDVSKNISQRSPNSPISLEKTETTVSLSLQLNDSTLYIVASNIKSNRKTPSLTNSISSFNVFFLSANRGTFFAQKPLQDDFVLSLGEIDPRLVLSLKAESVFSKAIKWLKDHENDENAKFREAYDRGDLDDFAPDPKLLRAKIFINETTGFQVRFDNNQDTLLVKNGGEGGDGLELSLEQLSQGEKIFISLAAGIATFVYDLEDLLTQMFPNSRPVIIIDEIDLHLHPKWQRKVIPALSKAFPECQFIITTHSPQVLGEVKPENIFMLSQGENGVEWEHPQRSLGLTSSEVLEELQDAESMSSAVQEKLDSFDQLIDEEKYSEARKLLEDMEEEYGKIPATVGARTTLEFFE